MDEEVRADDALIVLHERTMLKKFEGEPTPESVPFEVLVLEDGVIVDRWTPEEDRPCPEM